jgi:hypothetical protein
MHGDAEEEIPPEEELRVVHVARSMEELHEVLQLLHDNGVTGHSLPDDTPVFPYPHRAPSYRVRVGVAPEDEEEALIVVRAFELRGHYVTREATGEIRKALLLSTCAAAIYIGVAFLRFRDVARINYGVVAILWIAGFVLVSQVLSYRGRRAGTNGEASPDDSDRLDEEGNDRASGV